jgi:hypothetical protein
MSCGGAAAVVAAELADADAEPVATRTATMTAAAAINAVARRPR